MSYTFKVKMIDGSSIRVEAESMSSGAAVTFTDDDGEEVLAVNTSLVLMAHREDAEFSVTVETEEIGFERRAA